MKYVALVDYPNTSASYDIELVGVYDNLDDAIKACRADFNAHVEHNGADDIQEFYGNPAAWTNNKDERIVGCYSDIQWFIIT